MLLLILTHKTLVPAMLLLHLERDLRPQYSSVSLGAKISSSVCSTNPQSLFWNLMPHLTTPCVLYTALIMGLGSHIRAQRAPTLQK